ncbi:DNA polymerase IV [Prescottella agglutinans]|uniref:DNA polymerase IV n=1 Tax=Prescottella agglutinans TaxID=1644129 RepID=A0ABT6MFR1_9NOCA|nr:DNA polymerase IV [Prescottella agglutinans]MDH6283152.1 DNA polymerase-4 [Prescottella agglutinans]
MFVSEWSDGPGSEPPTPGREEATILHADLDAFYASVEQRDDPSLRGRPVIVGGGVVLAASYEAKAFGVRTASSGAQAMRQCPHAVVVRPRMSAYAEASRRVFEVFRRTTPLVEGISIDEAFLDVGGLRRISGSPMRIAEQLRLDVRAEVGLPITVGVARTKFLAKVASAVGKPDGLLLVPPDRELDFLHPLPVERLWGVGAVTSRKLHDYGVRTVGQLATLSERELSMVVGPAGARHLHALAWARDPRRVQAGRRRRSIGAQHALGNRPRSFEEIETTAAALVDRAARRLRAAGWVCRTVVLRLRFADFGRVTRSVTLTEASARTETVLAAVRSLLAQARPLIAERGLTLVGVALSNLDREGSEQLALPFEPDTGTPVTESDGVRLDGALDAVRAKFGSVAVTRAALLGRDRGESVPILPD